MATSTRSRLELVVSFADQNSRNIDFFQLIRLLIEAIRVDASGSNLSVERRSAEWDALFRRNIRVRPNLSMGFPDSDIAKIERRSDGKVLLETNFFGLYGVTSPLPHFYNEELIDAENQGIGEPRALLDLFHYAAFPLLVQAWNRYRLATGLKSKEQVRLLVRQLSWLGLVDNSTRQQFSAWAQMLPLAPSMSSIHRSASGLKAIVTSVIGSGTVKVYPCSPHKVRVPRCHEFRLGRMNHRLGESTVLGSQILDHASHVEICISGQTEEDLLSITPGGFRYPLLQQAIQLFLRSSLTVRCRAFAKPKTEFIGTSRLGLGCGFGSGKTVDSFLFTITS